MYTLPYKHKSTYRYSRNMNSPICMVYNLFDLYQYLILWNQHETMKKSMKIIRRHHFPNDVNANMILMR